MKKTFEQFVKDSVTIDRKSLEFDEGEDSPDFIGQGQFGSVYRAQLKGLYVAVKITHNTKWTDQEIASFTNEMKLMRECHHPNVVLFMGIAMSSSRILLITELMNESLEVLIHDRTSSRYSEIANCNLTTQLKLNIITQCCRGIQWLHDGMNIVHRDIKPANFLIDTKFHVKVCDFGFAEIAKNKETTVVKGTVLYCAPEVLEGKISKSIDIYALGITMWELFYEKQPFETFIERGDKDEFVDYINKGGRPLLPNLFVEQNEHSKDFAKKKNELGFDEYMENYMSKVPKCLEKIMDKTWCDNPSKRIDINTMIKKLEDAELTLQLSSSSAAKWWKEHFSTKGGDFEKTINVDKFVDELLKTHGIKNGTVDEELLEQTLGEDNEVSLDHFGFLTLVYGQFYKNKKVFNELLDLIQQVWFYSECSKDESQSYLDRSGDGVFLIRVSKSDPMKYPYTLTKKTNGKITHSRIEAVRGNKDYITYAIKTRTNTYSDNTLTGLVNKLISNKVVTTPRDRNEHVESEYG